MRFVVVLFLTLSFCGYAVAQVKSESVVVVSENEQLLRELAQKWIEADVKGDAASIVSVLADEFSFLAGGNKTQYLASMSPNPSLKFESAVIEDLKVQIYGDTAVLTGLNSYRFRQDGKPIQARLPSMTVWVKKNGRWQCVKACTLPALTADVRGQMLEDRC